MMEGGGLSFCVVGVLEGGAPLGGLKNPGTSGEDGGLKLQLECGHRILRKSA